MSNKKSTGLRMNHYAKRTGHYTLYTLGTYADCLMSLSIGTARGISGLTKILLKEKTPEFLDINRTQHKSPVYQARQTLRDKLDTEPGKNFVQSCLGSAPIFFGMGAFGSVVADYVFDNNFQTISETAKFFCKGFSTALTQIGLSKFAFMFLEYKTNPQKYRDDNNINWKKMGEGFWKANKTFLPWDLGFLGAKSYLQAKALQKGLDPIASSAIADAYFGIAFYSFIVTHGLYTGIIKTRKENDE